MTRSIITSIALSLAFIGPLAAEPARYATPFDALDGMISALQVGDGKALLIVFGPENQDMISSGDAAEDANNRDSILTLYREGYRMEPQEDGSVVIALGAAAWPFPIPLAKGADGWSFDAVAGRAEVSSRTVGMNELDVIELLGAYVEVQALFRAADHDGDGVMEFARRIISSVEARDGLFWPDTESPVGEQLARASESTCRQSRIQGIISRY